jgi:plasmid stability protein
MNLSIKNAPEDLVARLRARAARHHRSLQGELLAIVEAAARDQPTLAAKDVLGEVRRLRLSTPSEAAAIVRTDRDGR